MFYSILPIHSFIRWLVLLVALTAIIKFAIGWLRGGAFTKLDRGLAAAYSGIIDLQALLGIIMILGFGLVNGEGFPMVRVEHGTAMLFAIILAHLPMRFKNAADPIRFRNTMFCILGSFVMILIGVSLLPNGWPQ